MPDLKHMTIGQIEMLPEFAALRNYIFTNMDKEKSDSRLEEYGIEKSRLVESLEYAAARSREESFLLHVYHDTSFRDGSLRDGSLRKGALGDEDLHDVSAAFIKEKKDVLLMNFAVHPGKPYVLVCPGGGYNREWMLVEGYPLAMRINELGYNAFILVYRTGRTGLFPDPLEDVAAAVSYIERHKEELQVETQGYAVTGASAGGHLCAMWGTKTKGFEAYGCKSPAALLLSYPAAVISMFYDAYAQCVAADDSSGAEAQAAFLRRIGGEHFDRDTICAYSLETLIDGDYPPAYLVHAEDDPVVPVKTSLRTCTLLEKYGIQNEVRIVKYAGHSFGLGIGTDAEGWMDDAVRFWQKVRG